MALKNSTMLPLGTIMPHFELLDVRSNQVVSSEQLAGNRAVLVMFICRHCPYVVHVQEELANMGRDYKGTNLGMIAISSNDVEGYSQDAPHHLKNMADELGMLFPYCYDESQNVAKAFTAACTPDFFVFDQEHKLVYRGQLDESRPGNGKPVTGRDLRKAIDAVLAELSVPGVQKPSAGCNIKWKPGKEPVYA